MLLVGCIFFASEHCIAAGRQLPNHPCFHLLQAKLNFATLGLIEVRYSLSQYEPNVAWHWTDNLGSNISFHTTTQQTSSHASGCIALDITENETAAFCLSLPLPFNARLTDPLIAFHTGLDRRPTRVHCRWETD